MFQWPDIINKLSGLLIIPNSVYFSHTDATSQLAQKLLTLPASTNFSQHIVLARVIKTSGKLTTQFSNLNAPELSIQEVIGSCNYIQDKG